MNKDRAEFDLGVRCCLLPSCRRVGNTGMGLVSGDAGGFLIRLYVQILGYGVAVFRPGS